MSEETRTDQNGHTKIHEDKKKSHFAQGLRVLTIDDDVVSLGVLECNLQKCGYKVNTITDAVEAIEILRKNKEAYDIVITDALRSDINGMDGFQIAKIVVHEIGIPVIMMSANDAVENVEQAVKHGAVDFLVKPVHVEILKNIWQHVLRKSRRCYKCVRRIEDVNANANKSIAVIKDDREFDGDQSTCSTGENENSHQADSRKRPRVDWTGHLNEKFLDVVRRLEVQKIKVVPKVILKMMNEPSLTRQQVASHLQKHRLAADQDKKEPEEREISRLFSQSNGYSNTQRPFGQNMSPFASMYAQSQPPPHQNIRLSQCSYPNLILPERVQSQRNSSHVSSQDEFLHEALNLPRFGVPNHCKQQNNVGIQVAHPRAQRSNLVGNGYQAVGDIASQTKSILQHYSNVGPLSTHLPGSFEESKPLVIADPRAVDMGGQILAPKEEVAFKSAGYIPHAPDTANFSFEFEEIGALVNLHPAPTL